MASSDHDHGSRSGLMTGIGEEGSSRLGDQGIIYEISEHEIDDTTISDLSTSQDATTYYQEKVDGGRGRNGRRDDDRDGNNIQNPLNEQISILRRGLTTSSAQSTSTKEYWRSIEEIIELIPLGTFHSRILWICGIAFMADGMELALLAFISICAKGDLGLTDLQTSALISLVFLGEFFGSLSFGMIADKFGRLRAFLFACFVIALAGILSGYAESYRALVLSRMAVGFGVGGLAVPFDLVSEFSPTNRRGSLLVYLRGAHCIGAIYIAVVALILSPNINWRLMTFIATFPVILAIPCAIAFIPESPIWLLEQKRTVDAEKSLQYVAFVNGIALPQFRLLYPGKDTIIQATSSLFSFDLIPITVPLLILWFLFGFSYYGIVLFINKVFERGNVSAGDECSFRSYPIFWSAIAELIGIIFAYWIIDKLGRISTQTGLYAGAAVSVMMLSMDLPLLPLGVVAAFARGTITSAIAATWTLTPELYPTKLRSSGHSFANSFSRLGAFIVPYAIHNATNEIPTIGTGIILCVVNALAVVVALFLPETLGKPLHQETRAQKAINLANSRVVRADSVSGSDSESDREEDSRRGFVDEERRYQNRTPPEPFEIITPMHHRDIEHKDTESDDEKSARV